MSVFVLDKHKKPIMPCSDKRAHKLLKQGRAVIHKHYPFTIRMKDKEIKDCALQPIRVKIDPGSKETGIAVVVNDGKVSMLGVIEHKTTIKKSLEDRKSLRRGRRQRKTRYRKCRFENNTWKAKENDDKWSPPSIQARVDQCANIVKKIKSLAPVSDISYENVKFDMQLMDNENISGVEYQQGELCGYEIREYLLEKFERTCVYCGKKDIPLQIEHIIPKSRGGTNRINNLAISCQRCNQKKGNKTAKEFGFPGLQKKANETLKDAAAVNITRWKTFRALSNICDSMECGSGGRTKMQRTAMYLPKEHFYDALCVGASTPKEYSSFPLYYTVFRAMGRGNRTVCTTDKYGFPKTHRSRNKRFFGVQTGDFVKGTKAKNKDEFAIGRVNVRKSGSFYIQVNKKVFSFTHKNTTVLQRGDGWQYRKVFFQGLFPPCPWTLKRKQGEIWKQQK